MRLEVRDYRVMGKEDIDGWRNLETTTASELADSSLRSAALDVPALTILCHPDAERVGEVAALPALRRNGEALLSRLEPHFEPLAGQGLGDRVAIDRVAIDRVAGDRVAGDRRLPLSDHRLSRQPVRLLRRPDGGLRLDATATRTRLVVAGEVVDGVLDLHPAALVDGVVLLLASRVALLLHTVRPSVVRPPAYGMVGESSAMLQLRREIQRVADLDFPVLLRGESGSGKELVARAIQGASRRRDRPYFAVNVGAIPTTLAAAELFGAAKGAFSGADKRRLGYFQRADSGTLFLDEIGEMSTQVQALLLRALESDEIQPVGAEPQKVDVRVIAATDADLEQAIADGGFKEPLLHRLASYEIELPPLRRRRDDIGRLFFHFLRLELAALGESDRLRVDGHRRPWVSAEVVARLAALPWPGNVRQLRNVVRQLAVASRGSQTMEVGSRVESLLAASEPEAASQGPEVAAAGASAAGSPWTASPTSPRRRRASQSYRDPGDVDDDELVAALRAHQFRLQPTAAALGISRGSLYGLIDGCPLVRKASDLGPDDIEAARRRCGDRPEAMAADLEVSKQGLKMRLKELGMS